MLTISTTPGQSTPGNNNKKEVDLIYPELQNSRLAILKSLLYLVA